MTGVIVIIAIIIIGRSFYVLFTLRDKKTAYSSVSAALKKSTERDRIYIAKLEEQTERLREASKKKVTQPTANNSNLGDNMSSIQYQEIQKVKIKDKEALKPQFAFNNLPDSGSWVQSTFEDAANKEGAKVLVLVYSDDKGEFEELDNPSSIINQLPSNAESLSGQTYVPSIKELAELTEAYDE